MDLVFLPALLLAALFLANRQQQHQRIIWLARLLQPFEIEKLMEQVSTGYLRALGESDAERSEPIWNNLLGAEQRLSTQLGRLAEQVAREDATQARISRWPVASALAARWLSANTLDLRPLMALHAQGVAEAVANPEALSRRDQAFRLSAELFLFQHSCHWYCRSQAVASARLLARHQTSHDQVLQAVSERTRQGYRALVAAS
ncbi:hypothetical protein [Hydrogenophaga sp.]|uniref:hypothetical protein n=1 Tax=Hydrogenophaga sp. TaxID=1904254 RepID=UPI002623657F|nr:hypothetical protein [Hydrogenophaga sp.]MDM7948737.1 hypothetical protein [Hydrogenophaga sp.]